MLRNRGKGDLEVLGQVLGCHVALEQQIQQSTAMGIGDCFEDPPADVRLDHGTRYYLSKYLNASRPESPSEGGSRTESPKCEAVKRAAQVL